MVDETMGGLHQHCQVVGPYQRVRLLHLLGADILVCVHHFDQSLSMEVVSICFLRDWEESALEDRRTGGLAAEWAGL